MEWITPLFLRNDIDVAYRNERGQFNAVDINRINNNIHFLADLAGLSLPGHYSYKVGGFIYDSDFSVMRDNIDKLTEFWRKNYPTENEDYYDVNLADTIDLSYQTMNKVERILHRMYRAWEGYNGPFVYAGEIYAGEEY